MKTTKADFEFFKKECRRWIRIYGLVDMEIKFYHQVLLSNSQASWSGSHEAQLYEIYLTPKWEHVEYNKTELKTELRRTAHHEVTECFLSDLMYSLEFRYKKEDVERERHRVVHRLWNVMKGTK